MPYGALAEPPAVPMPERFEPGAFGDLSGADVILNRQHLRAAPLARTGGGGLTLADGPDALRMSADLPETREAADALTLVRAGILRGLSVEFRALRERIERGVRVIVRAKLIRIGLVDEPAYKGAGVEARQAAGPALVLVEGPAGAGKSQAAAAMLRDGRADVLADTTALWAALRAMERGPDGRYPVRLDSDPGLGPARYGQTAIAAEALRSGFRVIATTARPDQGPRWGALAREHGAAFETVTIDPGEARVRAALADADGELPEACERAVGRWYRPGRRAVETEGETRRRVWL